MTKYRFSQLLLCAACVLCATAASADKEDRNKPINIEADALRYDDLKQTSVFTGRVVVTKGSLIIRGDQVEVRQDPEGYQYGVVTADPGKLAYFRQKRSGGADESIEGEGDVIEYDGRADMLKLIRNAQLRRFRGAKMTDEVIGAEIRYNNITDEFMVDGAVAKGETPGRVRAVLTPKANTVATPASAPASAPPAGATLRSTPSVGKERK